MIRPRTERRRRGTMIPILAVASTGIFGFVALAVDLGVLAITRTECQNAADAAALAGARELNNAPTASDNNRTVAIAAATNVVTNNTTLNRNFTSAGNISAITAGVYKYDSTVGVEKFAATFPASKAANESWSAMKVTLNANSPTFFAKVFGINSMPTGAEAVAVHRPRDVAFVLDFSGSMGYGSPLNWPMGGTIEGLMNPDPDHPKFGHYARYTYYQSTSPSGASSSTVTSRPNPLRMRGYDGNYAPNNFTMESYGGPPMVEDFVTVAGDPTSVSASSAFTNAFKRWNPVQTSLADTTTLTKATFDYAGYNAMTAATPAPANFDTQSDTPIAYVGDKWPRTNGSRGAQSAQWSTLSGSTFTDNAVYTLQQFLNYALTTNAGRTLSSITLPTGGTATSLRAGS